MVLRTAKVGTHHVMLLADAGLIRQVISEGYLEVELIHAFLYLAEGSFRPLVFFFCIVITILCTPKPLPCPYC